ncbi:flagellar basal-body rod modification protein FlgD [Rhodopseudomonas rhenobacensis]|uniref:Basal-body rod modification protein FlgD n=1 Tax=Rhodopseudomonas rhenobacensis TaxID=87461 RepID=A0A7W7Z6Y0_9BRAD|nr:FlgD immunoglobulin-like domain containing protein [Rhodopseudomonas rhenobacensis]MBB5049141.1 flagellar basal-body rod modification protein FlgD [Rhodopseudomonas rhenobacensis]
MSVTATTAATTTTATTSTSTSTASSSLTSSDFLTLLVTELQNQNPLDPTSTTDFMTQLTSYANFDQQQTLNSNLSSLATSFNSLLTLNSSNYIGQTVTAKADSATLEDGQIAFGYSLNSAASKVTLTVADSSGNTVWTGSGTTTAGKNSFTWDGKTTDGTQLADGGDYTLSVSATDSSGNSVYGYTTISGKVTGVDSSSGTTMLTIGDTSVAASSIVGVTS